VHRILAVLAAERETARILLRGVTGIDEEFDRKLSDFYARVAKLIERGLRLGIEMRLVRPCDPVMVAWCVLGSAKETIDRAIVHGRIDASSPALEALGRELLEFNLRGIFA
jgi:hypothetical protein